MIKRYTNAHADEHGGGFSAIMPHIAVRPALASDKETVLAFCAHTWESGDYIESAWDTWLANPQGQLFTATADAIPVGTIHLQMLAETDAWIEGLRVDPEQRHQGIGRALQESAMIEAMRRGATYVRLIVDSENIASRKLSEGLHMHTVSAFALYHATPIITTGKQSIKEQVHIADSDDLDDIIDYLNVSNIFPLVGGLYYIKFVTHPITAEFLEQKIAAGQVYLLRRWERIDGLAIAEPRQEMGEQRLSVGYIDGTTIESISLIAYNLRKRLVEMDLEKVRIYAPDLVLVHDALQGIEYERNGSIFYTYERSLV